MLKSIEIHNLKCLGHVVVRLSHITILAGLNGMGKSTLIQSLLLLHQSALECRKPLSSLVCQGAWADIGREQDILWEGAESEMISIGLLFDGPDEDTKLDFRFILNKDTREFESEEDYSQSYTLDHGIFTDKFYFLRAERWGPRIACPISNEDVRVHRQLGRDGEFTAFLLSEFGTEAVRNSRLHHPLAQSTQLNHQAEAWLGEISPGTRLYTTAHEDLDLVSVNFAFSSTSGETNHYRATNVGFGMSYVLPIIVAALTADVGSMLLIENPEAHLHPQGQRQIAHLLAMAALGGVQIVVETHSDHFLNGLRLAVHSGSIDPEDTALHYFQRELTEYAIQTKVVSPKLDRSGRIDCWPDGFFDENEKALRELLRPPVSK